MKVAITGAAGRLGAALVRHFSQHGEVVAWSRGELDLKDPEAIRRVVAVNNFDVLINSAALTAVDYCETHAEEAMVVNGEAVAILAELCAARGARLVQISTDYVFDGEKREPYRESDPALPISRYGQSKLAGEEAALVRPDENLVVRVSWVYGPDRPAFPDMIIRRALQHERVEAISDKISTPSSSVELAKGLHALIEARATGHVHLCDGGSCTWQEYGQEVLDAAHAAGLPLKARTVGAIGLETMTDFVAQRPVYTALATDRFTEWTGLIPRPWQEPLREFVRERFSSPSLR